MRGRVLTPKEFVLRLANGNTIRAESYAENPAGVSYVRVCNSRGREVAYWSVTEWTESEGQGAEVMGAILGAAAKGVR